MRSASRHLCLSTTRHFAIRDTDAELVAKSAQRLGASAPWPQQAVQMLPALPRVEALRLFASYAWPAEREMSASNFEAARAEKRGEAKAMTTTMDSLAERITRLETLAERGTDQWAADGKPAHVALGAWNRDTSGTSLRSRPRRVLAFLGRAWRSSSAPATRRESMDRFAKPGAPGEEGTRLRQEMEARPHQEAPTWTAAQRSPAVGSLERQIELATD